MTPLRSASARIVRLPFHQSSASMPVDPGSNLRGFALELGVARPVPVAVEQADEPSEHVAHCGLPDS